MNASSFDIGGVLGFYGLVAKDDDEAFRTIYTDFTFEGGTDRRASSSASSPSHFISSVSR